MTARSDPEQEQGNAFWRFATTIYAEKQVCDACLRLQDRSGHYVNLLLGALWLTAQSRRISQDAGVRLRTKCERFQSDITMPLRQVRRDFWVSAKAYVADPQNDDLSIKVRDGLKAAELATERFEILMLGPMLAEASEPVPKTDLLAWSNFEVLTPWSQSDPDDLKILIAAQSTADVTGLS